MLRVLKPSVWRTHGRQGEGEDERSVETRVGCRHVVFIAQCRDRCTLWMQVEWSQVRDEQGMAELLLGRQHGVACE